MKRHGNKKEVEDDKNKISERVIQYVDDPKNSSALAKIHEMSNKAKRERGKSPTQQRHHLYFKNLPPVEPIEKIDTSKNNNNNNNNNNNKNNNNNFSRRSAHFATVKQKNLNFFNFNKNLKDNDKNTGKGNKKEYVWDKSINRLVEKGSNKGVEPIKEAKEKEEKEEIIEKLKQYKKSREIEGKNKKRIKIQVPNENKKFSEIVYEKHLVQEGENEDDFEKEPQGKNTKFYKKIVKNAPGSKTVITKKIIEENVVDKGEKLEFNDSSDEEDIVKELKKLKVNPSNLSKGNVKVKIITEEYDEKGNKIYSKEFTTNKLPKGLKGNDEILDEFEKFEDEFDE